ncbi:MAG: sensor histidine kinase [Promethearchaeota archaeon]
MILLRKETFKEAFRIQEKKINYQFLFENFFKKISENYSLESAVLCFINNESIHNVLVSYNISTAPLLGAKKEIFLETVEECFNRFPRPHIHSIKKNFKEVLEKIEPRNNYNFHMIFIPIIIQNNKYLFLGFPKNNNLKEIPEEVYQDLGQIILVIDSLTSTETTKLHLHILQNFVKEVGHDIASAVQATIAKLRNISRGLYSGEMVNKKAKEAEVEIMGAYRIAENLGFTVDPDYNIKEGRFFNIIDSVKLVIEQYRSEANERHIDIILDSEKDKIEIWGDNKGIESAIGQYLFNAIKYAFGSSYVKITISNTSKKVVLSVKDKGIPLPVEEKNKIWEFGHRGKNALEKHVNGAGIGLYTVKKIIKAHGGMVSVGTGASPNIVIFSFEIPKKDILKKHKILL